MMDISYSRLMKTLQEIVSTRLEELKLGPVEAAVQGGLERTYIRDIVVGKKQSVKTDKLALLARALQLDPDALARNEAIAVSPSPVESEAPQSRPKPNASFPPVYQSFTNGKSIPLMGQTEAGVNGKFIMNGQRVADVFCPPGLENVADAYAVRVYGTSMEPRFKAGETVWLNPQAPVRAGDDVVVQLRPEADGDEMASYIKEFRSKSSRLLRLWQHNPEDGEPKDLEFEIGDVFSVHKVVHHAMV